MMLLNFESLSQTLKQSGKDSVVRQIGSKALSLIELTAAGLPVPSGWVVHSDAFAQFLRESKVADAISRLSNVADNQVEQELKEIRQILATSAIPQSLVEEVQLAIGSCKANYAVRSSGSKEDLAGNSFAGLYESFLNVQGSTNVLNAIRSCWLSVFTPRVIQYCRRNGIPTNDLSMCVIVQQMVAAETSGVLFSVNPLSGRDTEILIEACFGLGETLVGGHVTPDQFAYNWFEEREVHRQINEKSMEHRADVDGNARKFELSPSKATSATLSSANVRTLSEFGLKAQRFFGFPVDIEWAAAEGQFWFVQSRPITRIASSFTPYQWTTADFKDGGVSSSVCSRMMWSLYDLIWEEALPSYIKSVHLLESPPETVWGDMFYGRPYWNASAIKNGLICIPGFVERDFDRDLGIEVGYSGLGRTSRLTPKTLVRGLRVLAALNSSFLKRLNYDRAEYPRLRARTDALNEMTPEKWSDSQLLEFFPNLIMQDFRNTERSYFMHIFDNSNVQTLFKSLLAKLGKQASLLNLVVGIEHISHLDYNFDLWNLSRQVREHGSSLAWWRSMSVENILVAFQGPSTEHFLPEMRKLVAKHRYRSTRELDITVPNFHEDPRFVFENFKKYVDLENEYDPAEATRKANARFKTERSALLQGIPFFKRTSIEKKLETMRKFLWWREELRDVSTRMYDQVRRFTLELSKRLVAQEVFAQVEDIFHLPVCDTVALCKGQMKAAEAKARIARNRAYYESFRNFQPPADLNFSVNQNNARDFNDSTNSNSTALKGIGCSPGIVTAKVRVVSSIEDTNQIQDGEILVTRFTDPAWTPVFGRIAGVVTETGGVLSHAAVIAREYGIPAVLAVSGATRKIPNGSTIIVDGIAGVISIKEQQ